MDCCLSHTLLDILLKPPFVSNNAETKDTILGGKNVNKEELHRKYLLDSSIFLHMVCEYVCKKITNFLKMELIETHLHLFHVLKVTFMTGTGEVSSKTSHITF